MTDNIMSLRRSGTTEVIQNVSCAFLNNNVADAHCVQVQREARKGLKPLVIKWIASPLSRLAMTMVVPPCVNGSEVSMQGVCLRHTA